MLDSLQHMLHVLRVLAPAKHATSSNEVCFNIAIQLAEYISVYPHIGIIKSNHYAIAQWLK